MTKFKGFRSLLTVLPLYFTDLFTKNTEHFYLRKMRINNLPGSLDPLYLVYSNMHGECLDALQRIDKVGIGTRCLGPRQSHDSQVAEAQTCWGYLQGDVKGRQKTQVKVWVLSQVAMVIADYVTLYHKRLSWACLLDKEDYEFKHVTPFCFFLPPFY